MSMLEDQLRTTLSARADAVTEPMLTRSLSELMAEPERDAAPVLLVPPNQPHRPHRSLRPVAAALAVAAVLLVAFGAVALHRTTHRFDPAHVRPRSAIPWNQVGPGWMLVQEAPGTTITYGNHPDPAGTQQLQLLDPSGNRYQITSLGADVRYLETWDGRQALLRGSYTSPDGGQVSGSNELIVMDLVNGTQHSFTIPDFMDEPRFGGSDDHSVVFVDAFHRVERYSVTGQPQQPSRPIPSSATVADSPDGRQAIVDGRSGLDLYDYDTGLRVGNLPPPDGYAGCYAPRWGNDGKLTASCLQASNRTKRATFVFSVNGKPAAGRLDPQYATGGNRITGFGQGAVSTFYPNDKNPTPDSFPVLTHLTASRLDAAGHTVPIPVPAQVRVAHWVIANSDANTFTVANIMGTNSGLHTQALRWNPFTGQVTELIHAATPTEVFVAVLPWGARQY